MVQFFITKRANYKWNFTNANYTSHRKSRKTIRNILYNTHSYHHYSCELNNRISHTSDRSTIFESKCQKRLVHACFRQIQETADILLVPESQKTLMRHCVRSAVQWQVLALQHDNRIRTISEHYMETRLRATSLWLICRLD